MRILHTKKYFILLALFFILSVAYPAHAQQPSCSFVGGISNGSISFGNIDPSSASTAYGTIIQQISFTCNKNVRAYTISVTPASGWSLVSGGNTIPFTIGITPSGTFTGTPINLLIAPPSPGASSILQTDYQNARGGAYTNAGPINITISYGGPLPPITATLASGSINATVINTCKANSPGTLSFVINPSITGTVNATLSPDLQIQCTKGDSVSVSSASTCGGKMYSSFPTCSGNNIPYTFTCMGNATSCSGNTAGNGFGVLGTALGIGGSVSSVNYENAAVGTYGDLQILTITY